ncbi:MAG: peptidyl-prolyl cis-trans isomerase [Bacteroidia bacterium]|nr:MAG: peptidyl-prolyl cis-trans isomerase [Bacteroidia bacterium]
MKTTFRILLVISALALDAWYASASPQKLSKDEREILWHQDQRSLGDSVLYRYLRHKDPKIRVRALIALANVQDTASLPHVVPLLSDRYSDVRAAAAFALGQIGSASAEKELSERLRLETWGKVIARLLEALGKSGSAESYNDVVAFGLPRKQATLRADQSLSLARYALRNIKSERGVDFCFDSLDEPDVRTRWASLYALWRMAPDPAIETGVQKHKAKLLPLGSDKSIDIRMHLASLMGRVRSAEALEILQALRKNEMRKGAGNWRVQVNVVKALASHSGKDAAFDALLELMDINNDHVRMTAITSIAGLSRETVKKYAGNEKLKKKLEQWAAPSKRISIPVRGEAMVALAKHFPDEFTYQNLAGDFKQPNLLRAKAVEALSLIPSSASLRVILDRLEDDSTRVAMAAWDFIRQLLAPRSFRVFRKDTSVTAMLGSTLFRKAKVSLLREDMAITTLVANALGDSAVYALLREENQHERALEELMLAYGKLSSPNDVEAMQAVLQTLGRIGDDRTLPLLEQALQDPDRTVGLAAARAYRNITGTDLSSQVIPATKPLYTDYDWKTLESIPANLKAEIRTERGSIVVRFHRDAAPFTVLSFYKLIRKKFFDGLTFHRVVPNFVIQGGDPRGDGWGGPNYALRSEFSLLNYGRGEVGVASAGKDTEGCQFFITHSPQPHLDGRYTIFASVESGYGALDTIQPGDKILNIRIKR